MFSRNFTRWLLPALAIAMCSIALAKSILTTPDVPKPVLRSHASTTSSRNNAVAGKQRAMTAIPNIDWKPGEPWPGEWIKYAADDVLPKGISIEVTGGVITGVVDENSDKAKPDILGTRYVVGDIDGTDVTPALWRILDLEMPKPDGSISKLSVARPLWWLQQTKAQAGASIDIGMQELGISGEARVLRIKPCPCDSRDNRKGMNLVIGKIEHHNAEVWELFFDNDTQNPLGVTANHPLYSFDRGEWIPAGELEINEKVQSLNGTATLTGKSKSPTRETVYNLEVHRSHSYHVGQAGLLAHNTSILECFRRPISWPSFKKVPIDMGEVMSGHTATGRRFLDSLAAGKPKDIFPANWSKEQIERTIREAYRKADTVVGRKVYSTGPNAGQEILTLQAEINGNLVQFFYNKATKVIDSAWMKGETLVRSVSNRYAKHHSENSTRN